MFHRLTVILSSVDLLPVLCVTAVALVFSPLAADCGRHVIMVDKKGLPLGIPNSVPCDCGKRMEFTVLDDSRYGFECRSCRKRVAIAQPAAFSTSLQDRARQIDIR